MARKDAKHESSPATIGGLRRRAEELLGTTRTEVAAMPTEDIQTLVYELQVYQTELEVQNEELRTSQLQLQDAKDQYLDLYEFSPVGYVTLDRHGEIQQANLTAATLLGVARGGLIGKRLAHWLAPTDADSFQLHCREVFAADSKLACEVRVPRPDGAPRHLRLESLACQDAAERHCRTAMLDITDWKLTQAIDEARILAEAIVETVREPLLILNTELRVQTANRSFYHTFQINRQETENKLLYELDNRQWDIPRLRHLLEQVLPDQSQFNDFEVQHCFHGTEQRTMLLNARQLDREGERPGLILLAIEDITDRRRLDAQLQESNRNLEQRVAEVESTMAELDRLAAIVESSDDAIIGKTLDGAITSWNRGAERLYGYSADEMIGQSITRLAPDHSDEVASILERLKRGEKLDHFETVRVRKDGTLVDVQLTISPIVGADGTICGASTIARDITDRKRADNELQRSAVELQRYNRELERSNGELQDFAHVVSHDLRAPLVNIQGFSKELALSCEQLPSVLGDVQLPEAERRKLAAVLEEDIPEALEFIATNATKMDGLLSGVLQLSRVGQVALTIRPLDIKGMLSEIVASRQSAIEQAGASVQVDSLPTCQGDEMQINQVFSNLLDNALKYLDPSRRGAIRICGREEPDEVVYSIEDNGIGIEAQHQDSIFKVFHRLDPRCGTGEGLGLSIVRRILDRHGGKIWVESQVNAGSTFYLSLPKG